MPDGDRPLSIGIVCPYSFDVPGGVQYHVRDLAAHLLALGHRVSVLAPADGATPVPPYVVSAGRSVAVPYNGSVARVNFGPAPSARVRHWLADHDFDILHIHEPITPSISLLALWSVTDVPVVATFHTANLRSRAMRAAAGLVRPALEKVSARIAVSEDARRTLVEHLGGDAVVIPNGVDVARFARAEPRPEWSGRPGAPTLAFLGRFDEARKGLAVLAGALDRLLAARPGTRVLVAGAGDAAAAADLLGHRDRVTVLGEVSDDDKAALLRSVDVYLAPHTGGESFGIVLVEAMSAGAAVVASDLPAFARVLDDGRLGYLFRTGDPAALAAAVDTALGSAEARAQVVARASDEVWRYDWSRVTRSILEVYRTVLLSGVGA